jgi:CDP-glucose 4,6-dehydratase
MIILDTFNAKTVLVTGHTGFKGAWLVAWLKKIGANVVGISLDPKTHPSHFNASNIAEGIVDLRIDIRNQAELENAIISSRPDFVFHLAAQALVRSSYDDPVQTWETNVLGTLHVLQALRKLENYCSAVMITSDKCYENVEWVWGYRENDALGGIDPYSASKGAAELAIRSQVKSFFPNSTSKVRIASARAGNVIGGGDWAPDRIVPDCVRAWAKNNLVELRNPHSTRPWQHVLEPLSGYLMLAVTLSKQSQLHGESFNFGPESQQNQSVLDLVRKMAMYWEKVRWKDVTGSLARPYESGLLKLNCDKALHALQWHTVMGFDDTVKMTTDWYQKYYEQPDNIGDVTNSQIEFYTAFAKKCGLPWAQ